MRKRLWLVPLMVVVAAAPCLAGARAAEKLLERLRRVAVVEQDVMVAMRDGVRLATDVVRPKGEGKVPVILMRTPYRKNALGGARHVRAGYALVSQDVRGRYNSEGEHRPFLDDMNDAYDTIAWLAKQPWCDGNVGMAGGSYVGFTQLAAALTNPPHLRCIMPTVPPSDFDQGTIFFSGALRMDLAQGWLLGSLLRRRRCGELGSHLHKIWRSCEELSLCPREPAVVAAEGLTGEMSRASQVGRVVFDG